MSILRYGISIYYEIIHSFVTCIVYTDKEHYISIFRDRVSVHMYINKKIRIWVSTLMILSVFCSIAGLDKSYAESKEPSTEFLESDYSNRQVLIMYKDGSIVDKIFDTDEALRVGLKELEADKNVEIYQPNIEYNSAAVKVRNDPFYENQWALKNDGSFIMSDLRVPAVNGIDINAETAWASYTPDKEVVIAVIDTGIDIDDAELKNSIWINSKEIPFNGIDDDRNGYIDDIHGWNFYNNNNVMYEGENDAHGTHCAGTIAAAADNFRGISGIADYSNIKIMPVKVLGGQDGIGDTLALANAIYYAEANGAQICNLSMGTEFNDPILYRVMANSKMLFCVAAGNDKRGQRNIDYLPSYPASYNLNNIISVTNIDAAGRLGKNSDYGAASVDLAAPGSDIIGIAGRGKYAYMTGTSMSAPMVSAAAAMVYTDVPGRTLTETKRILLSNTKVLPSLKGTCVTEKMLDLGAAINNVGSGSSVNKPNNIIYDNRDNLQKKRSGFFFSFKKIRFYIKA